MIGKRISHAMHFNRIDAHQVTKLSHMWQLWHWVHQESAYTDDHPRFNSHPRQFPHEFGFPLYPDNTNDATLSTGLRAVAKDLGIALVD